MPEPKLCPFRKTEDGGFALCYGNACAAYCEYESLASPYSENQTSALTVTRVTACKLMQPVPCYTAFNGPL